MKKRIVATALTVVMVSAGVAAASHHGTHRGYARGVGQGDPICQGRRIIEDNWLEHAPQAIKDAFKDMEVKHAEMRLDIARGNIEASKLRMMHDDILKSRRIVSDYNFEEMLKNPAETRKSIESRGLGGHMRPAAGMGGMHSGVIRELYNELSKDKPDTARARQIYTDAVELMEKQSKDRFELWLKYPENMSGMRRGRF